MKDFKVLEKRVANKLVVPVLCNAQLHTNKAGFFVNLYIVCVIGLNWYFLKYCRKNKYHFTCWRYSHFWREIFQNIYRKLCFKYWKEIKLIKIMSNIKKCQEAFCFFLKSQLERFHKFLWAPEAKIQNHLSKVMGLLICRYS